MSKSFVEITDLPQDKFGVLDKIRPLLVQAFNGARSTPYKMTLFKATLKFLYTKCVDFEKAEAERLEVEAAKLEADKLAEAARLKEIEDNKDAE